MTGAALSLATSVPNAGPECQHCGTTEIECISVGRCCESCVPGTDVLHDGTVERRCVDCLNIFRAVRRRGRPLGRCPACR